MKTIACLASVLSALVVGPVAHAGSAYDEFSAESNPSGAWHYGWTPSLAGAFTLFANRMSSGNHDHWYGDQPPLGSLPGYPEIDRNTVSFAGMLLAHPGPNGQYAVLRWIAPSANAFSIFSEFTRQDSMPTTTDVHVRLNGASLFSGLLDAASASGSFGNTLSLNAGDVLDFSVGFGANGNYFFDRTGINASVSAVPEPASLLLLLSGAMILVGVASRARTTDAAH